jgi:UDP-N-acetylglucosamine--N-acetylmuramyl-(pentapeptide) pyrophosphoryl-undecaprenol N-acetylglucosamine transferase
MPAVLIFGGSRGARPINESVVKALAELADKPYQVLYITGDVHYEEVKKEVELVGSPKNVVIKPFIHNMPEVLAGIDLVVSRAGATTLAEITSLGIPSILVPSPYVTNNHQEKNARSLSDHGAAELLLEKDLNNKSLVNHIDRILLDNESLKEMKRKAKKMGVPDSATRLYSLMDQLVKENQK